MRKSLLILLFCGSLLVTSQSALAQNEGIAVGAIINSPTGASVKAWINEDFAVAGAMSFNLGRNVNQFYIHGDGLKHTDLESDPLQLYYGIGARFTWTDIGNDLIVGVRGPGGLLYTFEESSIESFMEIAPTLDFSPDLRFGFAGAVGARIYLN